jgi:hypothetical protein
MEMQEKMEGRNIYSRSRVLILLISCRSGSCGEKGRSETQ